MTKENKKLVSLIVKSTKGLVKKKNLKIYHDNTSGLFISGPHFFFILKNDLRKQFLDAIGEQKPDAIGVHAIGNIQPIIDSMASNNSACGVRSVSWSKPDKNFRLDALSGHVTLDFKKSNIYLGDEVEGIESRSLFNAEYLRPLQYAEGNIRQASNKDAMILETKDGSLTYVVMPVRPSDKSTSPLSNGIGLLASLGD